MSRSINRRDVDFLLYEVFHLDEILRIERFSAYDRTIITGIFDVAQRIAENEFVGCAASLDANEPVIANGHVHIDPSVGRALGAFAEASFFAATLDEADGGLQLPWMVWLLVQGIFQCANVAIANYALLTAANLHLIQTFGTQAQKQRFVPAMLAGQWLGTMCLSETQAGSSLADISTRAEPAGDGRYRITGTKMWISGGDHDLSENIVHLVLAKATGSPAGVKGISLFVVPKYRINANGSLGELNNVALAGLNHKMGQRGTTNCVLNFGEAGDCFGELIGEPGRGLAYMFHMMNEARLGVGMGAAMLGLAGYIYSLDYARTRLQGRSRKDPDPLAPQAPIIEHADVKRMLLAQKAAVEGATALICYCGALIDRRQAAGSEAEKGDLHLLLELLTPIAKSWPSEHCLEANSLAIQILGGYGYTRDHPVERFYRDNRLNHIHEGTYGIQGIDLLGRKIRAQDGRALTLLIETISDATAAASAAGFSVEAASLDRAIGGLVIATRSVTACSDLNLGLANATLYLEAFGQIVIAWMWLLQASKAQTCLAQTPSHSDRIFYAGKLTTMRYFFRYELPKVTSALELIGSLDDTCLLIPENAF